VHRIRHVIDESLDLIFSIDQDGCLSYANRAFATMAGKSAHQVLGFHITELGLPAAAAESLDSAARSVLESATHRELELSLPSQGTGRMYHVHLSPDRADDGVATAVIGVLRDVTDLLRECIRRQNERAFRESLESSLLVGISTLDLEGRHDYVNPAFCRMVGLSAEQLRGARPPFPYWAPEEQEQLTKAIGAIVGGNAVRGTLETVFMRPDGTRFDVQICWAELRDGTGVRTGWVGSFGDITAIKQREREIRELNEGLEARVRERTRELVEAKEELESFSRSLIHDVGNQVVVVGILARRLQRLHETGNYQEETAPIDKIRTQARRIEELMRDLGRLLRAGKIDLAPAAVDLSSVAREIAGGFPRREEGTDATWVIPAGITAQGDPRLLRTLLENLLGNAWKFSRRAELPRIEFGRSSDGVYFVRDNGCGFDPAAAEKIFEPFRRLHDEEEIDGTGMGLAIVERIVARHGGQVWAEGAPGRGACFFFTLPGRPSTSPSASPSPSTCPGSTPSSRRP
jgi:PAS domain S-box-containing protein